MRRLATGLIASFVVALAIGACGSADPSAGDQLSPSAMASSATPTAPSEIAAYKLDCGPVTSPDCEQIGFRVASQVTAQHPGRFVTSVRLVNRAGAFVVRLDDGATITGFDRQQATPAPSPASSPSRLPSPVAAAGDPLAIECDGPAFAPELLDTVPKDDLEDHPSAEALAVALAGPFAPEPSPPGWWRIARDDTSAFYLGGSGPVYSYFIVRTEDGEWLWDGRSGECKLRPDLTGRNPVTWTLDPSYAAPTPQSTSLHLLVTEERCASGKPVVDRLLAPAVVYEAAGVFVTFAALPLPGDGQDCPANVPDKVTVQLREPLGDRKLRGWDPPLEGGG